MIKTTSLSREVKIKVQGVQMSKGVSRCSLSQDNYKYMQLYKGGDELERTRTAVCETLAKAILRSSWNRADPVRAAPSCN